MSLVDGEDWLGGKSWAGYDKFYIVIKRSGLKSSLQKEFRKMVEQKVMKEKVFLNPTG